MILCGQLNGEMAKLVMVDQSKLPGELVFVEYDRYEQVAEAIKTLVVRGAPAIGVSGAFGMASSHEQIGVSLWQHSKVMLIQKKILL